MSETDTSNAQGPKRGFVRLRLNRLIAVEANRMMCAGQLYDVGPDEAIRRITQPPGDPDAVIDRTENHANPISYSDEPWALDQWHDGVRPCEWAILRDPPTFQDIIDNWPTIVVAVDSPVNWLRREDYWQPVLRMQEYLWSDLKVGKIDLGSPPRRPHEDAVRVSESARKHVIDHMIFGPIQYFQGKQWLFRVYPGDRFVTEAPAPGPPKHKGGRPREWDWDGALRHMIGIAAGLDGFEGKNQADLVRTVQDYFADRCDKSPADSTTKDFVKKYFKDVLDGN